MLVNDLQHNGHSKTDGKQVHIVKSPVTEYWNDINSLYLSPCPEVKQVEYIERQVDCLHGFATALIKPPGVIA
jgi:hypothetical protein